MPAQQTMAKVPCLNKSFGCVYTFNAIPEIENHLNECIFREMECPLGVALGKCSWQGLFKEIKDHYQECHPNNVAKVNDDVVVKNVFKNNDPHFFLVSQAKLLFIITIKLDAKQKLVYWAIQHIGTESIATQHLYEIHLISNQDEHRKVVYTEQCFSTDLKKTEDIFRREKCAVLSKNYLETFIQDDTLTFGFSIKKIHQLPKGKTENSENNFRSGKQGHQGQGHKISKA